MTTPVYIIDGYNVLHKIPQLRNLMNQSLEIARQKLEQYLRSYQGTKRIKVILVYDGERLNCQVPNYSTANFKIIFSHAPVKADPVIKKLIKKNSNPKQLFVITADRDILQFAKACSANTLDPHAFFSLITKKPAVDEISRKYEHTMSDKELAEWMALFEGNSEDTGGQRGQ